EQLAPGNLTTQRRFDQLLPLLLGTVLQNGGNGPGADDHVGPCHVRFLERCVDGELLCGCSVHPVRFRPVRHEISGGHQLLPLLGLRQGGNVGRHRTCLCDELVIRGGVALLCRVDVDVTTMSCTCLLGGRAAPVARATEPCAQCHGSPQVQMRVVFPGEADTAEYLDAVLGVVHCGVERVGCRRGSGECVLLRLPIGSCSVPGEGCGQFRPAE